MTNVRHCSYVTEFILFKILFFIFSLILNLIDVNDYTFAHLLYFIQLLHRELSVIK